MSTVAYVFEKIQKNNFENFQKFWIFRVKEPCLKVHNFFCWMLLDPKFLPDLGQPKDFILSQSNRFGRTVSISLKLKNCLKHDKQRHLVSKMKFKIFQIEVQGPFPKYTTVFERCYHRVKSSFFGISTPNHTVLFSVFSIGLKRTTLIEVKLEPDSHVVLAKHIFIPGLCYFAIETIKPMDYRL